MPQNITISTLAELKSALATATGGEVLLLKGGDYGELGLSSVTFPSTVTITSADPADPAVFSGMSLSKVGNLTFDGVVFDYTFKPGDPSYLRPFEVKNSHDVTIRNSTFDGDLAKGVSPTNDGYGHAFALGVTAGTKITIENNEFYDFFRGAVFTKVSGLVVTGNDLHRMSSDGMDFAQVQDVLIEGNFLHDFLRAPDSTAHLDMIQFWTNGTNAPSGDIIIRGNRLDVGDGVWTQSIFMRNEMVDSYGAGEEMFYYNVLIEDNVIVNGHLHGITVGEADGLVIRNNTLVHGGSEPGAALSGINLPAIHVATKSTDVTITDNITTGLKDYGDQPGWRIDGNLILAPKDYDDAFITSTTYSNNGIHDFRPRPGGAVDLAGAGAAETLNPRAADLTAQFNATLADQSLSTWVFDGSAAQGGAEAPPPGTVFFWDFGDGNTATGRIVSHSYAEAGYYQAKLTIHLPDGRIQTAHQPVSAADHQVLKMRLGAGFVSHDMGSDTTLANDAVTADGLVIGAPGTTASIGKRHVADLIGNDSFGIDLSLTAASAASAGEVFRLHGSVIASVTSKGEFSLQFFTATGDVKLTTSGAGLGNGTSHDIRIAYIDDQISVSVDGKVLASATMLEPMIGGGHDLTFGNPWGKANFSGVITEFSIDRGNHTLPDAPRTLVLDETWAQRPADPHIEEALPQETNNPPPAGMVDPVPADPRPTLLDLGETGVAHAISRAEVKGMLANEAFSITLGLQADSPETKGEVFRIHQSIITSVTATGEFKVQAFTSAGEIMLTTRGAGLGDLGRHEVGLSLMDGVLSITVDGAVKASTAMAGTLLSEGRHDLTFGNPWGKQNFDGALTDFEVSFPTQGASGQMAQTSVRLDVDPAGPSEDTQHTNTGSEPDPITNPKDPVPADPRPTLLDLGETGVAHAIARAEVKGMLVNEAFSVTLGLQADSPETKGEVFRIHQSVITSVTATGEFKVQAFTSAGEIMLTTRGAGLGDLGRHEVGLSLMDGVLSITVDGAVKASTAMAGTLLSEGRHDLTFGNPWGKQNFDGALTDFEVSFPTQGASGQMAQTSVKLAPDPVGTDDALMVLVSTAATPDTSLTFDTLMVGDNAGGTGEFSALNVAGMDYDRTDIDQLITLDRFDFLAGLGGDIPQF